MKPLQTITPVLRYRDPSAAAEWLCTALGFTRAHASGDDRGQPHFISLKLGDSFVLACPATNPVLRELMVQPADLGGANTQICYLTVPDLDRHSARAAAAGATIELAPQDDGAGGHFYLCRDPEGHLWSVGTRAHGTARHEQTPSGQGRAARRYATAAAILLALGGWILYDTSYRSLSQSATAQTTPDSLRETAANELARRLQAEAAAKEKTEALERMQILSAGLKDELRRAQADLSQARRAREDADRAIAAAKAAGALAEQSSKHATDAFVQERAAAKAAQEARSAKIAQLQAAVVAERERGTEAFVLERAAARAAQQAHDARAAKIGQLEAAVQSERQLRLAAEMEVASLRAQLGKPPQATLPNSEKQEKVALFVAREATERAPPSGKAGQQKAVVAMLPPGAAKTEPPAASACASAVHEKIPFGQRGSKTWDAANLVRLCKGAETSAEPAKCFGQLMTGKVSWGGGKTWKAPNALALCGGTQNAGQTLECFSKELAGDQPWRAAIGRCRAK